MRMMSLHTWSTMSMVTSPAEGMAAAPMAARVAVRAMTQMLPNPRATPCACTCSILARGTVAFCDACLHLAHGNSGLQTFRGDNDGMQEHVSCSH